MQIVNADGDSRLCGVGKTVVLQAIQERNRRFAAQDLQIVNRLLRKQLDEAGLKDVVVIGDKSGGLVWYRRAMKASQERAQGDPSLQQANAY